MSRLLDGWRSVSESVVCMTDRSGPQEKMSPPLSITPLRLTGGWGGVGESCTPYPHPQLGQRRSSSQIQHLWKGLTLSSVIASAGSESLLAGNHVEMKPRWGWTLGL